MKNLFSLSLNECSAIRGIAIIMIFVHNYCHWIFSAKENEYQFSRERSRWLWRERAADVNNQS